MSTQMNEYAQPIGQPMPDWKTRPAPGRVTIEGQFCRLEPLSADRHAEDLYTAYSLAADDRDWTYMPVGPFNRKEDYLTYVAAAIKADDPMQFAVIDLNSGKAVGTLALMRQDPTNGVIEVGYVTFSPRLKQTPLATEAQFLLMSYVFEGLGYRRYEWKCDSLNAPSRRAAQRLGFTFEGIFRQALVYKGRNRDTAWYSIIDYEWPEIGNAFRAWLEPGNFDADGSQRRSLSDIRSA